MLPKKQYAHCQFHNACRCSVDDYSYREHTPVHHSSRPALADIPSTNRVKIAPRVAIWPTRRMRVPPAASDAWRELLLRYKAFAFGILICRLFKV